MSPHKDIFLRFFSETFSLDRVQRQVSFCYETKCGSPLWFRRTEGRISVGNACLPTDVAVSCNICATGFSDWTFFRNQLALCTSCGLRRLSRLGMDPPGFPYGPVPAYSQYNKHVSPNCLLSTLLCWLSVMDTLNNLIDFWLMLNPAHKTHTWLFLHFKERKINPE